MTVAQACPCCGNDLVYDGDALVGCESGTCNPEIIRSRLIRVGVALGSATSSPLEAVRLSNHSVPQNGDGPDRPALGELLDDLVGLLRRFVVMTEHEATAVALWIVHTHAFDAAMATPYLAISSAEKESGKTRLLEVLDLVVARPWLTGRVTAAVLPRKIEQVRPTLLLDESDAAFKGEKEYAETLRGVLNSGHRQGGKTTVCVGQGADIGFKDFSVFCPKAIAGIGTLPDTVASRSIPIRLKRRAPGEKVERFRYEEAKADVRPLVDALETFGQDEPIVELQISRPELPEQLGDRAADCWEPLLAIADLAGGDWSVGARNAALALSAGERIEEDSTGVRLLADIKQVFDDKDRLRTQDLLDGLHCIDEAPWGDWFGKPLAHRALARLLHPYGVKSKSIRIDDGTPKGFMRDQFEDPWRRYLPSEGPSIRNTATNRSQSGIEPDFDPQQESAVADTESTANPHEDWDVADVADLEWQ